MKKGEKIVMHIEDKTNSKTKDSVFQKYAIVNNYVTSIYKIILPESLFNLKASDAREIKFHWEIIALLNTVWTYLTNFNSSQNVQYYED